MNHNATLMSVFESGSAVAGFTSLREAAAGLNVSAATACRHMRVFLCLQEMGVSTQSLPAWVSPMQIVTLSTAPLAKRASLLAKAEGLTVADFRRLVARSVTAAEKCTRPGGRRPRSKRQSLIDDLVAVRRKYRMPKALRAQLARLVFEETT